MEIKPKQGSLQLWFVQLYGRSSRCCCAGRTKTKLLIYWPEKYRKCRYANISQFFGGVQKYRYGGTCNFESVYLLQISADINEKQSRFISEHFQVGLERRVRRNFIQS